MTESHDDRARAELVKARAFRWGGLVLMLIVLVYAVFGAQGFVTQYRRYCELEDRRAELRAEQEKTAKLEREVAALRSDDLAIERAIRTELDYQRPGEIVLIVGSDDPLEVQERDADERDE